MIKLNETFIVLSDTSIAKTKLFRLADGNDRAQRAPAAFFISATPAPLLHLCAVLHLNGRLGTFPSSHANANTNKQPFKIKY